MVLKKAKTRVVLISQKKEEEVTKLASWPVYGQLNSARQKAKNESSTNRKIKNLGSTLKKV
jgi:site-specific DNA-adenine methylase